MGNFTNVNNSNDIFECQIWFILSFFKCSQIFGILC